MSSRAARVSGVRRRRERPDQQHVRQLAVQELLEQPGRVGGQPAGGSTRDVAVGRLLDPQDEVLVGSGQYDAAHRKLFP